MLRRLTYALAAAAVALGIAAGLTGGYPAIAGQVPIPPDTDPPGITNVVPGAAISDRNYDGTVDTASLAPPPALAGFKTRSGGTEVSISHPLPITPSVILAGFNSTKMGTEVSY